MQPTRIIAGPTRLPGSGTGSIYVYTMDTGEDYKMTDLCRMTGVSDGVIRYRIKKFGVSSPRVLLKNDPKTKEEKTKIAKKAKQTREDMGEPNWEGLSGEDRPVKPMMLSAFERQIPDKPSWIPFDPRI